LAHLVLVIGPPGSGRTTVLAALETLGFASLDTTGRQTTHLLGGSMPAQVAIVVDLELDG
jgi:predicted ATPase